jgi:acetyl-CoA carboxylase carboxyltransferase component
MSEKVAEGLSEADAKAQAENEVADWQKAEEAVLAKKYEEQLMNPNEALSLGSISQIVMPSDLRKVLSQQMDFHMRHYQPEPLSGVQREFH